MVHVTGGAAALVGIAMLGPRDGVTFTPEGVRKSPPGQSANFMALGTFALWCAAGSRQPLPLAAGKNSRRRCIRRPR